MEFNEQQTQQLSQPINPDNVSFREGGGGLKLAYVESWHVIQEANRIFGFGGWSSETLEARLVSEGKDNYGNSIFSYIAKVRVTVGNVIREGYGSGHGRGGKMSDGEKHESAIKEAESDARKRALMQFGDQFGLSLYDKEQNWAKQKSQKQTQSEPSVTEMALKWIQKASSQKHLNEIKKRLDAQMKQGNLTDSERHKLTNAIVQKEASLL
jgi:DNA recombination protein Rad52